MSTTPPEEPPQRRLLAMAAPPAGTRLKDMSNEERRAWARSIAEQMAQNLSPAGGS